MYGFVFGTPHGFCCSDADKDEEQFLESFYNRGEKGKTTYIHKRFDGKVFYTRTWKDGEGYNVASKIGRPGAFIGVSIEFQKEYYKDFKKIDKLLDEVYNNVVKAGLVSDNGKGGIQFKITKFTDHQDKINAAVGNAIKSAGLEKNDLVPFEFKKREGAFIYNPQDVETYMSELMQSNYDLVISQKCPTLAMQRKLQQRQL